MIPLTVFCSGALVMIVELLGTRVLAPFVGGSLIVWTNLIGVIMVSLSLGYWLGGVVADRSASRANLGKILILAASAVALLRIIFEPVMVLIQSTNLTLPWQSFFGGLALFFLPSLFLGMVTPYAVKLTLHQLDKSGRTVGQLSALSTMGSIVGTFSAGFLLIPFFGTKTLLVVVAAILLALALALILPSHQHRLFWSFALLLTAGGLFWPGTLNTLDFDTPYSHVWIRIIKDHATGRPIKLLQQNHDMSSGVYVDDPTTLAFEYTRVFDLAFSYQPDIKNTLMIGGAAYSYPQFVLANHPGTMVDVVEIDPAITNLAKQYFGLTNNPRLQTFPADARTVLNGNQKKYDAIFFDAFNAESAPFYLTTSEVAGKAFHSVTNNGLVVLNIVSSLDGRNSRFLWDEYATYRQFFPYVTVYPVNPSLPKTTTQNIVLIAHKSTPQISNPPTDQTVATALQYHLDQPLLAGTVLTDDYAPVEYLVARALTQ